jgi:hypothetical protein
MMGSAAETPHESASPVAAGSSFLRAAEPRDIMKPFDPLLFMNISTVSGFYYKELMKNDSSYGPAHWKTTNIITIRDRASFDELYETVEEQCVELDLTASVATIRKMRAVLEKNGSKYGELFSFGDELYGRIHDEMKTRQFLALSMEESARFINPKLSWKEVVVQFPSATVDIEEATRCIALSRATAGVFHMMRSMEIAIRATARCLGIADPVKPAERNWGVILQTLKNSIDAHNQGNPTWTIADDGHFFEDAYASFDAVRNAWRNPTMHVERTYTEDDAEDVWRAVRALTRKLASRCDENGDPRA